jgi:hypothetical protein
MPASSITSTSRAVSPALPYAQPCSRLAIVREPILEPPSRLSSATPNIALFPVPA